MRNILVHSRDPGLLTQVAAATALVGSAPGGAKARFGVVSVGPSFRISTARGGCGAVVDLDGCPPELLTQLRQVEPLAPVVVLSETLSSTVAMLCVDHGFRWQPRAALAGPAWDWFLAACRAFRPELEDAVEAVVGGFGLSPAEYDALLHLTEGGTRVEAVRELGSKAKTWDRFVENLGHKVPLPGSRLPVAVLQRAARIESRLTEQLEAFAPPPATRRPSNRPRAR